MVAAGGLWWLQGAHEPGLQRLQGPVVAAGPNERKWAAGPRQPGPGRLQGLGRARVGPWQLQGLQAKRAL